MAVGCVLLVALLLGAIRFDLQLMMLAMAALLGGIVGVGLERLDRQGSRKRIGRGRGGAGKALIGLIDLRVVAERPTLH